jgi:hypothetical protein
MTFDCTSNQLNEFILNYDNFNEFNFSISLKQTIKNTNKQKNQSFAIKI